MCLCEKEILFQFWGLFVKNTADIIAFHSTCWKESDAGMQPTTHIKHLSTASKLLAYYEQQR
jgi:hypothetical protein